jgi:hypothetical protein
MTQGSAVGYKVTGVTQETKYSLTGSPIPGKNVTIETTGGYAGTLFIPDTIFGDAGAVQQAIENEVRSVTAAMNITGTAGG